MPIDIEHLRGISIVAWPLENGEPKPDWKPATDTIAGIRPGSYLNRTYERGSASPTISKCRRGSVRSRLETWRIRIPAS